MDSPSVPSTKLSGVLAQTCLREGEDFYLDGTFVVFTEAYHLRRGTCCESGCRHCPYREPKPE
jgi:hypothetical protein